jgi:probable HAF family extracellular repeat protein
MAMGINDAGEIVGGATNNNDQAFLAFLWKNGVMTDLGTLNSNGDDCSLAFHINSEAQIVGFSWPCATGPDGPNVHGFLWQNGFMTDLNAFVPPGSGLTSSFAGFISERGEIAGAAVLPDGDTHALLLVPCREGTDGCVDAVEGVAATPDIPARSAGTPRPSIQRRVTPAQMLAPWLARLAPH